MGGFRKAVVGSGQRLKMGKMLSFIMITLTHTQLALVGREERERERELSPLELEVSAPVPPWIELEVIVGSSESEWEGVCFENIVLMLPFIFILLGNP